ncbi:MAG: tetratricopeptide repeat protein [Candidatus Adiutrix sp.]|jgi:tetratricopeptide (TPR) repeat protein|nr:tetratricopeptide repeat protein [Candidatus Adiutrix sp.]
MFKKGRGAHLSPVDLKRFGRRFAADLEAILPGQRCRLVPLSGWPSSNPGLEGECLVLPLNYRGRELGYLLVSPVPTPEQEKILSEMARQGLETMWLRKALLIDRETGLFSRDYFKGRLPKALRRRPRPGAARSLSLAEASDVELMLVMAELREAREPHQALLDFAARLSARLPLRSPARLSSRRLAFLAEGCPEEVRLNLESALDDQLEAEPGSRPVAGWSRWPGDLESAQDDAGESGPGRLRRQALEWWEKADVALFYARQSRGEAVGVAFGDLISSHGQVIQVLPMDRVIINLGRATGAAAGQVFLVNSPVDRPSAEPEFKGELTIFETADSYSLATAKGIKSSRRIVAGDRLTFSRRDFDQTAPAAEINISTGFLAKLPPKDHWLSRLEHFKSQPLALALARLDGYEKTMAMLGREEGGRLLNFIFEKVRAGLPDTTLLTLWQPDLLVLAWPGGAQAEIKPAAHRAVADLKDQGPISIGLVFSAGAESAEELVEDGRKALHEAAFTGPGQVAVFGPLALNISGDRLFEGGDLTGALREYERGLSLAPDHLNLLNSLGVCQGRLGHGGDALATFEKIARLEPQNMMAHYNLGYTHLLSGRLLEAEEALGRAAELNPDNFETLFHLGKTSLELGHLDRALPALKRAGEMGNTRPAVFRLLGEALMLAHDHQAALAAFKKAVKAAPNDAYALSALGALFVDLANDLPVARSLFQRSVEIDPTNSLYRQRLGRLLFTLGEYDGAEHHLKMAMEYGSRAPEVHYHLGCLAEENGRREEALTHFRAALEQDPAYQPALEKIG